MPSPSRPKRSAASKPRKVRTVRPALREKTTRVLQALFGQHPNAFTELDFRTPFELLVATIMSAQSTDQARQRGHAGAVQALSGCAGARRRRPPSELEREIKATGFFRRRRKPSSAWRRRSSTGTAVEVPADMDALTALPGVGRKTANVVLGHALGVPGLPVDRHVLRVANRLGIAQAPTPEEVEAQLCASVAARAMDPRLRHADPPRPPHLPPAPAVRPLRRRRAVCDFAAKLEDRTASPRSRPPRYRASCAGRVASPRVAPMARLSRKAFRTARDEAVLTIPTRFRDAMNNVAVVVEDEPSDELLDEMEIPEGDTLYGLYQGTPLHRAQLERGPAPARPHHDLSAPDRGRRRDEDDIVWMVGETVIHEFGHYFGLSEEEIEAIEDGTGAARMTRGHDGRTAGRWDPPSARPRKRFGQHFLERAWVDALVGADSRQLRTRRSSRSARAAAR